MECFISLPFTGCFLYIYIYIYMSLYVLAAASDWPISLGGPHGKRKEINWPFYGNLGLLDFVLRLRKEAPPVKEWNRIKVDSSDWIFFNLCTWRRGGRNHFETTGKTRWENPFSHIRESINLTTHETFTVLPWCVTLQDPLMKCNKRRFTASRLQSKCYFAVTSYINSKWWCCVKPATKVASPVCPSLLPVLSYQPVLLKLK